MKVVVFVAAICVFALVMPWTYAEAEDVDEPVVREARSARGLCLPSIFRPTKDTSLCVCFPCQTYKNHTILKMTYLHYTVHGLQFVFTMKR